MKKTLLFFSAFFSVLLFAQAQNSATLNIHHKLANSDFAFEEGAKNNMGHDFNVNRLEYYMSSFSFIHDGGQETALDNSFHVLVDASESTEIDMGEHEITELEAIRFFIGVHPDYNHADPSGYQFGHPLAPTSPSMHWGWAAGYRFLAMEGYGGSSFSQLYQLHGLGDDNYFMVEVPLNLTAENGELIIDLDGDYTRALEDISVNSGVIVHGEIAEAKLALENFRDYVFSPSGVVSSTIEFDEVTGFNVFPNPSNGETVVSLMATKDFDYQVSVTNMLGQEVQFFDGVKGNTHLEVQLNEAGIYWVSLMKEGQSIIQKKLIVQ